MTDDEFNRMMAVSQAEESGLPPPPVPLTPAQVAQQQADMQKAQQQAAQAAAQAAKLAAVKANPKLVAKLAAAQQKQATAAGRLAAFEAKTGGEFSNKPAVVEEKPKGVFNAKNILIAGGIIAAAGAGWFFFRKKSSK